MKLLLAVSLMCLSAASHGQPVATARARAEISPEIVCKRFAEPGSFIKKRKLCLTRMQWSQLSEAAQRNVEHLQFNNIGGPDACKPGAPGC